MTFLFCAIVAVTNLCGTVSVDTYGARVVSYVPAGGEEVFFVSESGTGGMPLCWPWFAGHGPFADSRRHGLARYCEFRFAGEKRHSAHDSELTFRLVSDESTRSMFPHEFELTVSVRLAECLTVSMVGRNIGTESFAVTEALHPYFAVSDQTKCTVEGECVSECRLVDPVKGRVFAFTQKGADGYYVWRPNSESHLSGNVSPIGPDDWRRFICVENGTLKKEKAYVLNPGESHTLVRTVRWMKGMDRNRGGVPSGVGSSPF